MTAVLSSFSLVPELQHYFHQFVIGSQVNKEIVPPPTDIDEKYIPTTSFIDMLFDDNYSKSNYEYKYIEQTNIGCIPRSAIARLQIYPGSWKYLTLDDSGDNVFALKPHDFVLLDALLAFRNGANDSTSLLFVDSSSISFVMDTTGIYTLYANYNALSTKLSKLIYLYLRLEVLHDFSLYNNDLIVSCGTLLETCFEAYLVDKYFDYMTNREPDLIYNCQCPGD